MAASKDAAASKPAPPQAADKPATASPAAKGDAKSKGLAVLEGLLGKESAPVIPLPGRNKLEPAKKAGKKSWLKKLRWRHAIVGASFLGLVAVPATLASLYMAFIAADQYHSTTSFAVRSIEGGMSSDILGMFTQASGGSTVSDSYILMDYILSERMAADADRKFKLEDVYSTRGLDYFYGIGSDLPIEDKLYYWRDMVNVNFDHASGIMQVTVKAFEPKQARQIAQFIVDQSDNLVNSLSLSARNDVLRAAQDEVLSGEARLSKARAGLRVYRDKSQEISPEEGAKLAVQLIGSLEQQLTQLNADLATAKSQMGEDTPRIRVLKTRIESLEQQLAVERQRLGTGEKTAAEDPNAPDVAGRIAQFEELETEREFAERAYTAALSSLEKARIEANNRQRYLALFIEPTLSEMAQYPARLLNSLLVILGLLFAWGIGVMSYYNIRDRA
ncbi:RkpR, polysaccharide export protein [Sinorhizobium fredii USDA 205]|uniref:RkpR, polysaccharide export protein n=1 Tax=Rhizobium fredii TaxID=380 RepID=A0A844AH13_RHIFR|nr:RkpR, polysaccharide export protein [Sinorhizobium fredii]ASY71963.1 Capsular polysaccharide export system inner membrane protein KpsE [Sinorhizobium fredii CCBAU 83666]KSV81156.1 RkpR, polysaccharide export protein [Sinorhizobium fredii USDA 205]MQX12389.1 RkpR, polysaccharide export protein [Sinorhizobium fredii]GEC34759.1 capsule polysaccharide transporter [Sinorhizobium fredii]GLS08085.1 capsule polysaccharide transporter [Sinorhizobium fredii]